MSGWRHRLGFNGSGHHRFAVWLAVFGLLANLLTPLVAAPSARAAAPPDILRVLAEDAICHANGEQTNPAPGGHHGLGDACPLCLLLGHGGAFVAAMTADLPAGSDIATTEPAVLDAQAPRRTAAAPLGSRAPPPA